MGGLASLITVALVGIEAVPVEAKGDVSVGPPEMVVKGAQESPQDSLAVRCVGRCDRRAVLPHVRVAIFPLSLPALPATCIAGG
jgi:hypothetical protein